MPLRIPICDGEDDGVEGIGEWPIDGFPKGLRRGPRIVSQGTASPRPKDPTRVALAHGDPQDTVDTIGEKHTDRSDPSQLGALAAQGHDDGMSTATIGIGPGYDESLLVEIANQGKGVHRFAYTADDAEAVLTQEAGDLMSKSAVNVFLRIRPEDPRLIDRISTLADATRWTETGPDGHPEVVIPLGDMYSGEAREILFQINIPGIATLGARGIATLAIEYVVMPDLESQRITWPIAVNVVPGDQASHRIPDPTLTTARLIAEVNRTKWEISEALCVGNTERAALLMDAEVLRLSETADAVSSETPEADDLRTRLHEEAEQARKLATGARERVAHLARKSFEEDRYYGD